MSLSELEFQVTLQREGNASLMILSHALMFFALSGTLAFVYNWHAISRHVAVNYPDIWSVASGNIQSSRLLHPHLPRYRYIRKSLKRGLLAIENDPHIKRLTRIELSIVTFVLLCAMFNLINQLS